MNKPFEKIFNIFILLILLFHHQLCEGSPRQSVNIDVNIPNDAFKQSLVVNLGEKEVLTIRGSEGSIFDDRKLRTARKLLKLIRI